MEELKYSHKSRNERKKIQQRQSQRMKIGTNENKIKMAERRIQKMKFVYGRRKQQEQRK